MPRSTQPGNGILAMVSLISGPERRVLDVGCGDGKWASYLKGRVKQIDGLEAYAPYKDDYCLELLYDTVFVVDARTFNRWDDYDVVILGDVLEHLPRAEALSFIDLLAGGQADVYLTVPVSTDPQNGADYGNPFESHLDQWDHETLTRYGFDEIHRGSVSYSKVIVGTYILNKQRWAETKSEHR